MEERGLSQRDLDFMEAEKAREIRVKARVREREIDNNIRPVVDHLGAKHFAHVLALGVDKQDRVYHWIDRRNGQRSPAELLAAVHEAPGPIGEKAMGDYCEARGYERPRRKLPATGETLARAYEERLRAFGEQGERAIAEAREQAARTEPRDWERPVEPPVRVVPGGGR